MNPFHPDDPEPSEHGKSVPDDLPAGRKFRRAPRPAKDQGIAYAFRAFKHRGFRIFWFGALASNTGTWLSNLAVPYVLYTLTGSAVWVAYAAVAQFVPAVLLGPLGGSLADRYNRRKVLISTQAGTAVIALLMWGAWATGFHDPLLLLGLVGMLGVFNGLNMPSWQSFVNDLVPRKDLLSAITLNSLQFNAARSLGPAIAGVLLAGLGPSWAFFLNAMSFIFVIGALLIVTSSQGPVTAKPDRGVLGQFLQAGRYVLGQPGILIGIILSMMIGLLGNPLFQLTVVFAEDVFKTGPTGLGLLNTAMGVGAVLAAPLVSGWSKSLPVGTVVKTGMLVYGLGLIAFGLTNNFVVGLISLVVVGACFLAAISGINTAIQVIVAERMRGRVIAVRHIFFTAAMPAGALIQGAVADRWGVQMSVILAGSVMLTAVVIISFMKGRIGFHRLSDPHDEGQQHGPGHGS